MKNRIAIYFTSPMNILWGILGFLSAIILILFGYFNGTSSGDTLKFCIISLVLLTIIVYYIGSLPNKIEETPFFNSILIGSYLAALLLIMAINKPDEIIVWMAGGLIISILFDMQLGLLFTYDLIIIASFIGKFKIESIVFLLIIGTLMCMISNSMKKLSTVGYSIIIVLSVQVTLLFIINNFYIWDTLNIDAVYNLFSILLTICIGYFAYYFYQSIAMNNKEHSELIEGHDITTLEQELTKQITGMLQTEITENEVPGTHTYDEIIQQDFPLLLKLKEHSEVQYEKSIYHGVICENAAKAIGAREKIAKAGGMYYDIGIIDSSQYVEAGIKLVEDYHLPDMLKDIILQHNLKYDTPKTPEAAIVMIAVSIISTKEYFKKKMMKSKDSQNEIAPISMEKIVENVFLLRLSKGSLDESGLSLKQFNALKSFFLHM